MNDKRYDQLTRLKADMDYILEILRLIDLENGRYRMRKLFIPRSKSTKIKWGHSYGLDQAAYDLDKEDLTAIKQHFEQKYERLKTEFQSV